MTFWLAFSLQIAAAFGIGAIPFGLFVGQLHGIDVRKLGSGNVGAMNVGRLLGRKWFMVVFLLDMLKGLAPTLIGGSILSGYAGSVAPAVLMLARLGIGVATILGHNYSPFLGFRGGKGVSTSLGAALGIYPDLTVSAILAFLVWGLGFGLTRMSSVGSILGGISFPLLYMAYLNYRGETVRSHWPFMAFCVLVGLLVVVRHKSNIARILAGTEARIGVSHRRSEENPVR